MRFQASIKDLSMKISKIFKPLQFVLESAKSGVATPAISAGIDTRLMGTSLMKEVQKLEQFLRNALFSGQISSQQIKEANTEVARIEQYFELYKVCRKREKLNLNFSEESVKVSAFA